MNPIREADLMMTRRQLFGRTALGLGTVALADVMSPNPVSYTHLTLPTTPYV